MFLQSDCHSIPLPHHVEPIMSQPAPNHPGEGSSVNTAQERNTQAPSGALAFYAQDGEDVDDLTIVYTFFLGLRMDVLRKIGRHWGRRSTGNKPELLYRNFIFLKECKDSGKDIFGEMGNNIECPRFASFRENQERTCAK